MAPRMRHTTRSRDVFDYWRHGSGVIETFEGSVWSRPEPGTPAGIDPATNAVERVLSGLPSGDVTSDIAGGFGSL